jgi:hypothetical protein
MIRPTAISRPGQKQDIFEPPDPAASGGRERSPADGREMPMAADLQSFYIGDQRFSMRSNLTRTRFAAFFEDWVRRNDSGFG